MNQRVYLDNAASTPMHPEVFEAMLPYLRDHFGNPSSVHAHGRILRSAIEKARKSVAAHLGASPGEIFFTSGGTEADNAAIFGAVRALGIKHLITTRIEHHAVGLVAEYLEHHKDVSVTWLELDRKGNVRLEEIEQALRQHPGALVSVMHANNELGTVSDIRAIGELCKTYHAYFHTDTVQSMGHFRYNLRDIHIHFLTCAAHKLYGPKGTGFLYIREGTRIEPLILGGAHERNMRAGTENVAGIVGLSRAMDICYGNLEAKNEHLWELKEYMRGRLTEMYPGIVFNGEQSREKSLPTVLNVTFPVGEEEGMILFNLDIRGISASGGSACTSGSLKGSFVLHELGLSEVQALNSVRFSFGMFNTIQEIEYTLSVLQEIIPVKV